MEFLVEDLIANVSREDALRVLRTMARADGGLYLAAQAVARHIRRTVDEAPTDADWPAAASELVGLISARFEEFKNTAPEELPGQAVSLLWAWWHLDREGVVAWVSAQVGSNAWSMLDVLARLVPTGTASGGGPVFKTLGDLDLETIDDFFGIDQVLADLTEEIDGFTESIGSRFAIEPTWENRRKMVLTVLRAERNRREALNQQEVQNQEEE